MTATKSPHSVYGQNPEASKSLFDLPLKLTSSWREACRRNKLWRRDSASSSSESAGHYLGGPCLEADMSSKQDMEHLTVHTLPLVRDLLNRNTIENRDLDNLVYVPAESFSSYSSGSGLSSISTLSDSTLASRHSKRFTCSFDQQELQAELDELAAHWVPVPAGAEQSDHAEWRHSLQRTSFLINARSPHSRHATVQRMEDGDHQARTLAFSLPRPSRRKDSIASVDLEEILSFDVHPAERNDESESSDEKASIVDTSPLFPCPPRRDERLSRISSKSQPPQLSQMDSNGTCHSSPSSRPAVFHELSRVCAGGTTAINDVPRPALLRTTLPTILDEAMSSPTDEAHYTASVVPATGEREFVTEAEIGDRQKKTALNEAERAGRPAQYLKADHPRYAALKGRSSTRSLRLRRPDLGMASIPVRRGSLLPESEDFSQMQIGVAACRDSIMSILAEEATANQSSLARAQALLQRIGVQE